MKYSERGISQCILPVMKCCETKNSFIYIVLIKHSLVVKLEFKSDQKYFA